MLGGSVGFFLGDIRRLSDDMKALKPTLTPAVPRLLNRIYDKVHAEINQSCIKKTLFNMAMSAKESEIKRGVVRNNSIWDLLVFKKIQEGMGGRIRLMVVGSAPLAEPVLTFTRCALGCLVRNKVVLNIIIIFACLTVIILKNFIIPKPIIQILNGTLVMKCSRLSFVQFITYI